MAASLLRLGRVGSLKCLLHESWGTRGTPFVAALCTKADAPPKTTKKAKAASKTIEAEERASLLAYKPTVAFPSKLSAAGFLPKDIALGESSAKVTAETVVASVATTEQQTSASQPEAATSEELTKETENAAPASETVEAISASSSVADTAAAEVAVEETEIQTADDVTTASKGSKASDVKTEVQQDQKDTSSSSSSDSDSDSESDSDDENSEITTKTEPVKSEGKDAEEKETHAYPNKQVESESVIASGALFGESQKDAKAVTRAKPEEVVTSSTEAVDLKETLIDPAPVLCTSMTEATPEVTSESITVVSSDEMVDNASEVKMAPSEDIVENEAETKAKAATEETQQPVNIKTFTVISEDTPEACPKEVANIIVEASPGIVTKAQDVDSEAVQEVVAKPKSEDVSEPDVSETVAKAVGATGIETNPSEDLKDPSPVAADSVESLAEAEVVETSEEQAPEKAPEKVPEPEPEPEPFDNTTYKNLQHHNYNMYTFADMDVEMSKYRLPQPSSGRPSPRH